MHTVPETRCPAYFGARDAASLPAVSTILKNRDHQIGYVFRAGRSEVMGIPEKGELSRAEKTGDNAPETRLLGFQNLVHRLQIPPGEILEAILTDFSVKGGSPPGVQHHRGDIRIVQKSIHHLRSVTFPILGKIAFADH